jgi:hypothetical protein
MREWAAFEKMKAATHFVKRRKIQARDGVQAGQWLHDRARRKCYMWLLH